jgi:hypothetical protein
MLEKEAFVHDALTTTATGEKMMKIHLLLD